MFIRPTKTAGFSALLGMVDIGSRHFMYLQFGVHNVYKTSLKMSCFGLYMLVFKFQGWDVFSLKFVIGMVDAGIQRYTCAYSA